MLSDNVLQNISKIEILKELFWQNDVFLNNMKNILIAEHYNITVFANKGHLATNATAENVVKLLKSENEQTIMWNMSSKCGFFLFEDLINELYNQNDFFKQNCYIKFSNKIKKTYKINDFLKFQEIISKTTECFLPFIMERNIKIQENIINYIFNKINGKKIYFIFNNPDLNNTIFINICINLLRKFMDINVNIRPVLIFCINENNKQNKEIINVFPTHLLTNNVQIVYRNINIIDSSSLCYILQKYYLLDKENSENISIIISIKLNSIFEKIGIFSEKIFFNKIDTLCLINKFNYLKYKTMHKKNNLFKSLGNSLYLFNGGDFQKINHLYSLRKNIKQIKPFTLWCLSIYYFLYTNKNSIIFLQKIQKYFNHTNIYYPTYIVICHTLFLQNENIINSLIEEYTDNKNFSEFNLINIIFAFNLWNIILTTNKSKYFDISKTIITNNLCFFDEHKKLFLLDIIDIFTLLLENKKEDKKIDNWKHHYQTFYNDIRQLCVFLVFARIIYNFQRHKITEVLNIPKQVYDYNSYIIHPLYRVTDIKNVGLSYAYIGKFEEAEKIYKKLLNISKYAVEIFQIIKQINELAFFSSTGIITYYEYLEKYTVAVKNTNSKYFYFIYLGDKIINYFLNYKNSITNIESVFTEENEIINLFEITENLTHDSILAIILIYVSNIENIITKYNNKDNIKDIQLEMKIELQKYYALINKHFDDEIFLEASINIFYLSTEEYNNLLLNRVKQLSNLPLGNLMQNYWLWFGLIKIREPSQEILNLLLINSLDVFLHFSMKAFYNYEKQKAFFLGMMTQLFTEVYIKNNIEIRDILLKKILNFFYIFYNFEQLFFYAEYFLLIILKFKKISIIYHSEQKEYCLYYNDNLEKFYWRPTEPIINFDVQNTIKRPYDADNNKNYASVFYNYRKLFNVYTIDNQEITIKFEFNTIEEVENADKFIKNNYQFKYFLAIISLQIQKINNELKRKKLENLFLKNHNIRLTKIFEINKKLHKDRNKLSVINKELFEIQDLEDSNIYISEKIKKIGLLANLAVGIGHEISNPLQIVSLLMEELQEINYENSNLPEIDKNIKNLQNKLIKCQSILKKLNETKLYSPNISSAGLTLTEVKEQIKHILQ